eukprot:TRINITY_DN19918_c1_g1_i1.p1 TRINITY_DN19918_c1_g1~~TRINITY_DN19918_c1_g1_i1.p1  ORF type:complete len:407 (+),score=23.78 TRINITY_DN19918_c1_g1_i1:70-1290(+)
MPPRVPNKPRTAWQLLSDVKRIENSWNLNHRESGSKLLTHLNTLRESLGTCDNETLKAVDVTMELLARKRFNFRNSYLRSYMEYVAKCKKHENMHIEPEVLMNILYASAKLRFRYVPMHDTLSSWCDAVADSDSSNPRLYAQCLNTVAAYQFSSSGILDSLAHNFVSKEHDFFSPWDLADILIGLGKLRKSQKVHDTFEQYAQGLNECVHPTTALWLRKKALIVESAQLCGYRSKVLVQKMLTKDIVRALCPRTLTRVLEYIAFVGPPYPIEFLKLCTNRIIRMHDPSPQCSYFRSRLTVEQVMSLLATIPRITRLSPSTADTIVRLAHLLVTNMTPVEMSHILFLLTQIPYDPGDFYEDVFLSEIRLRYPQLPTSEAATVDKNLLAWENFKKGGDLLKEIRDIAV